MATAEGGSGFNIHPMEQFLVKPLFGGTEVHWYTPTNATLWMLKLKLKTPEKR